MPGTPRITLRDIAQRAGVSAMTVSRALRNEPRVSAATREKILEVAREVGYQPDPQLSRIMTQLQDRRRVHHRETIAVVREAGTGSDLPAPTYQYVPFEAIRERANRYGYEAEEFWLGADELTPRRLNEILHARGIRGVIASPQSNEMPVRELDFHRFAAATFGYGLPMPLHRSAGNMTLAIQLATRELDQRGYRRIGLAVSRWVEDRAEHAYTASMLLYQQALPDDQRVPPFLFSQNDLAPDKTAFHSWLDQHRPDALITFDQVIPGWLKAWGYTIPDDLALVVHDWTEKMTRFAGIDHRRTHVAAAGVDLVVAQLMQNETGLPEAPRQILIPPVFREGPSVPKQKLLQSQQG